MTDTMNEPPQEIAHGFTADEIEPSLGEIYALLVAQNELLQRYVEVVEQVATEIGPVISDMKDSPLMKILGVGKGK